MEQSDFTEVFRGPEIVSTFPRGGKGTMYKWEVGVQLRGTGDNDDGDYTLWEVDVAVANGSKTRYRAYVIREGAMGVGVTFRQLDLPRKGSTYSWYKGKWQDALIGLIDWVPEEAIDWILAMDDLVRGIGLDFPLLESTPSSQPNPFLELWEQDKH